jgi:3-oxoacyl-[acyl-carrier protein] reductase
MTQKVFFLTGCASGIGKHLAQVLSADGHTVVATDIKVDGLPPASDTLLPRALDVRDDNQWGNLIQEVIDSWGRIDILINIAAYLSPGYIKDMTADDIHQQMDVNAKGVMLGMQAVIPHMIESGTGHIINIASLAGIAPIPGIALYSASKHAVRAISIAAALELAKHNIAVSVICPDAVQTPMLDLEKNYDEAALVFTAPRVLTVEDVEKAIRVALKTQRTEITLPRHRGWLVKVSGILPGLARVIHPILTKQGLRKLRKIRASESE